MKTHNSKPLVESSRRLSMPYLKRLGYLKQPASSGTIRWSSRGAELGKCDFSLSLGARQARIWPLDEAGERETLLVKIMPTQCYFGGVRWWFLCPSSRCGRRVRDLFLLSGRILCRHCGNLTYFSCRSSHRFDSLFKRMGLNSKDARAAHSKWF